MDSLQLLPSKLIELALSPFESISPLWVLSLVSVMTGLLMLLIFRYTSDQQRIRETKNAIKAHLLELWLFRDDLRIMLSAQGQILRLNGRYLRLAMKPMMFLILPVALLLISLEAWFGYRPLRPGEVVIVSMRVSDGKIELLERASLEVNGGLTVETPPLRIPLAKEVDWRIRATAVGTHTLQVKVLNHTVEKPLVVSDKLIPVSPRRVLDSFWNKLLNPMEPPIPSDSPVEQIAVHYPARKIEVFGWEMHWIAIFFIISVVSVLSLKGLFRVEL